MYFKNSQPIAIDRNHLHPVESSGNLRLNFSSFQLFLYRVRKVRRVLLDPEEKMDFLGLQWV